MNKSRKFAALLFITVIMAAFTPSARAQDDEESEEGQGMYIVQPKIFYGGLVAGANFSQVDGDYFAGYHKVGANVGGIVYTRFNKHLALSLEILYSQKGSKSNLPEPSPAAPSIIITNYGIAANYAEIPVMINYFDRHRSNLGIGVSYSRLVNSNEVVQTIDSGGHNMTTLNFNQEYPFKKNNFDFIAGANLHLWKGLYFNIRFQYSIVPIRTTLPPPDYARADQYNNMWVVRLMYLVR